MKPKRSYRHYSRVAAVLLLLMCVSCSLGYKNNGKEVTWNIWNEGNGFYSRIVNADPKTFEDLDDGYGRDKTHAFFQGGIINGADGSSFRTLKQGYAADNRHVYLAGNRVENADPGTFKVHTNYFAEDTNDFFWMGKALNVRDKKSFQLLGNADSWETLWAKDKYNGYYLSGNSIAGIDYETFHPVDAQRPKQSGSYAADKSRVYFMEKVIPGADPETFEEIDFYVGQDKHRAYKQEKPLEIKDYTKLTRLGRLMYSDGINIYDSEFHIMPDADVSTFVHISDNWYKDKNNVWWNTKKLPGANPNTFSPVRVSAYYHGKLEINSSGDFNFGKDEKTVFFQDSIIQGADPESFEKINFPDVASWTVFDRNRVYQGKDSPKLKEYLKKQYGK